MSSMLSIIFPSTVLSTWKSFNSGEITFPLSMLSKFGVGFLLCGSLRIIPFSTAVFCLDQRQFASRSCHSDVFLLLFSSASSMILYVQGNEHVIFLRRG